MFGVFQINPFGQVLGAIAGIIILIIFIRIVRAYCSRPDVIDVPDYDENDEVKYEPMTENTLHIPEPEKAFDPAIPSAIVSERPKEIFNPGVDVIEYHEPEAPVIVETLVNAEPSHETEAIPVDNVVSGVFTHKLSDAEAHTIYWSDADHAALALQYDVSVSTIKRIKKRQAYKHVWMH